MFKPVQFPPEVETLVRFVEETDPGDIVDATLTKLRQGVAPVDLLRAAVLATCRSTELPPEHHGGPVHPVCGVHGVYHTSRRLQGEMAFLPIVQHLALCNNHIHSPQMGPYIMPHMEPLESRGEEIGSYHITDPLSSREDLNNLSATEEALVKSIGVRKASAAEQYYLWLQQRRSPGEILARALSAEKMSSKPPFFLEKKRLLSQSR